MLLPEWLAEMQRSTPARWWSSRGRPLLDLIEGLPPTSRVREAISNDPEQAHLEFQAWVAGQDENAIPAKAEDWTPSLRDWDFDALVAVDTRNLTVLLLNTLLQANGGKPIDVPLIKSPTTEFDRMRAEFEKQKRAIANQAAMELIWLFAPHTRPT